MPPRLAVPKADRHMLALSRSVRSRQEKLVYKQALSAQDVRIKRYSQRYNTSRQDLTLNLSKRLDLEVPGLYPSTLVDKGVAFWAR